LKKRGYYMKIPEELIKKFYKIPFNEVSFGYTTISIYHLVKIREIIEDRWLIVGNEDLCGDSICIDIIDNSFPVYLAPLEDLETDCISSSFDNFIEILKILNTLSEGRKNPVELENNPLPENIRENFLSKVEEKNPDCELQFWESIFEEL
jgi:hypothetical protein